MYVGIGGPKGYEQVTIREDVYIPATGGKKTRIVRKVGKLSDLLAEDPDFLVKLKEEVRLETLALKEAEKPILLPLSVEQIEKPSDAAPTFLFGHAVVNRLWQILGLDAFLKKHCTRKNASELCQAVQYLVTCRCLSPDSVRACTMNQNSHGGLTPLSLDVLYTVLDVLCEYKDELVKHLSRFFRKRTKRKNDVACYDVTTYSFESTKWGELRLFGFSKEHKNNEVQVVMGLLIDNNGIPIDYELFPGNTMDQNTLRESMGRLQSLYGLGKITVVADRGMNSSDDFSNRMQILERLSKKLEKPSSIRAAIRKGGNQYLQIDLDNQEFSIDEERVTEAARYDGYYAVVTDRLDLSTEEVMGIYRGQWKIEESFRILKTDLKARPVFVWTDEHIKGHFVMCYLALSMIRYLQYLMGKEGWKEVLSAEEIMTALKKPQVVVQGTYPDVIATPINVSQEYLDIMKLLKMKDLRRNMTLT